MFAKSGGFTGLLDPKTVTQCPLCDADNPDVENRGFCTSCGTLFRDKVRWRLTLVKAAAWCGGTLTLAGAALALLSDLHWVGIMVFLLGLPPLALGVVANREIAEFLLEALSRRTANETQRSLRTTDRVAMALLVYFVAAIAVCVPYYLYIERPRQRLDHYQSRFEGKAAEYAALVAADAVPDAKAQPYLAGKAVILEKSASGYEVSEAHLALPPEVRAEMPEEVGTVVLVDWADVRKGPYPNTGQVGYYVQGNVRMIDVSSKTLLAHEAFLGGDPPDYAPRNGKDGRGPKPFAKITGYVGGLDRKPIAPAPPAETPTSDTPAPADAKPNE